MGPRSLSAPELSKPLTKDERAKLAAAQRAADQERAKRNSTGEPSIRSQKGYVRPKKQWH